MQLEVQREKVAFPKVILSLTLESQKEVDILYSLFNHTSITDLIRRYNLNDHLVREKLEPFKDTGNCSRIHSELCSILN